MNTVLQLGIDTSKDSLVNCLVGKHPKPMEFAVGNTDEGVAQLLSELGEDVSRTRVCIEATSRYHCRGVRALVSAGANVTVVNPTRSHALAVALGLLDKDDKVDARMLAKAAKLLEAKDAEFRTKAHEDLRDLSRLIDTLTKQNAEHKKRAGALEVGTPAHGLLKETIKLLAGQIKAAKAQWKKLLKQDAEILRRFNIAMSVKDVGKETARVSACELPARLEDYRSDQLCAYAAVVPRRNQSGNQKVKASVGNGGNSHLRTGIYMAASHSVYLSKVNESFYLKLRAKGKTHHQAMVAVMHRLLRNIIAVLKRNEQWQEAPPRKNGNPAISAAGSS